MVEVEVHEMLCTIEINGILCPVTNLFGIDGDELDNTFPLYMAFSAVVHLPDGQWLATTVEPSDLKALS